MILRLSYYVLNLGNGALKGVCNFNIVKFVFQIVCELQILMKLKKCFNVYLCTKYKCESSNQMQQLISGLFFVV
jgi:hypothetical protein